MSENGHTTQKDHKYIYTHKRFKSRGVNSCILLFYFIFYFVSIFFRGRRTGDEVESSYLGGAHLIK